MEIVYDDDSFEEFVKEAFIVSEKHSVLIDRFLEDAVEVDVDCVSDGKEAVIAGIMEHIEEAGIHSGDSACVLPCITVRGDMIEKIKSITRQLAIELKVKGLLNIQFAVKNDVVYVLEANPRASRTIPFVSKATGVAWAKIAATVMSGRTLKSLKVKEVLDLPHVAVKESVFPFNKFPGADTVLGPEMKSTGEVMGIDADFGRAYFKSQLAAGQKLPFSGTVFVSVKNKDKRDIVFVVKKLEELGFKIIATEGTASALKRYGISADTVRKAAEKSPNIIDLIKSGVVSLIINTPAGKGPRSDDYKIRLNAIIQGTPFTTTISGAQAVVSAIEAVKKGGMSVKPVQEYYKNI